MRLLSVESAFQVVSDEASFRIQSSIHSTIALAQSDMGILDQYCPDSFSSLTHKKVRHRSEVVSNVRLCEDDFSSIKIRFAAVIMDWVESG